MDIINYLKIKEGIQTSGQPKEDDFALIRETGVNTVINLAMHDSETALTNEGEVVCRLLNSLTIFTLFFLSSALKLSAVALLFIQILPGKKKK